MVPLISVISSLSILKSQESISLLTSLAFGLKNTSENISRSRKKWSNERFVLTKQTIKPME